MNRFIRQSHRWLSIFFTVVVLANIVAYSLGQPMDWLTYLPLLPLFLMIASGLYMFFAPYFARRRA